MAKRTKSRWFTEFVDGVRAPMTWANIDQYDGLAAFSQLTGDERREAEDVLIERLEHNDGRAARALADLGCTRAIEPLRERLDAPVPNLMRLAAGLALHRMGDDAGRGRARRWPAQRVTRSDRIWPHLT